ncbi:TRAP transporter small permease [Ferviditalea candida]|uniref:TRAP transporter small permease n=1 Tax=Ferviditalea candida TaxID=3108399 RepID=A0ABU5ZN03_9BACL|nr:TRAP transporter small permease [Paenibacillaceae bacterium T2]
MRLLRKIDEHFEEYLSVILFSLMTLLIFLQIIFRFLLNASLDWTEELARYSFVWLVYLSASLGVKKNRHIRVELVEKLLPQKASKWFGFLAELIWLLFSLTMVKQGYLVAKMNLETGQNSPSLNLPMGFVYAIIPIGFGLISLRVLQKIILRFRNQSRPESSSG